MDAGFFHVVFQFRGGYGEALRLNLSDGIRDRLFGKAVLHAFHAGVVHILLHLMETSYGGRHRHTEQMPAFASTQKRL